MSDRKNLTAQVVNPTVLIACPLTTALKLHSSNAATDMYLMFNDRVLESFDSGKALIRVPVGEIKIQRRSQSSRFQRVAWVARIQRVRTASSLARHAALNLMKTRDELTKNGKRSWCNPRNPKREDNDVRSCFGLVQLAPGNAKRGRSIVAA
jgi:hypothetical protein